MDEVSENFNYFFFFSGITLMCLMTKASKHLNFLTILDFFWFLSKNSFFLNLGCCLSASVAYLQVLTVVPKTLFCLQYFVYYILDSLFYYIQKSKVTVNPISQRICLCDGCNKPARTTKERGTLYCSNECIVKHCRYDHHTFLFLSH